MHLKDLNFVQHTELRFYVTGLCFIDISLLLLILLMEKAAYAGYKWQDLPLHSREPVWPSGKALGW